MTPRLIEVGPRLFETEEWQKVRQRFSLSREPEVYLGSAGEPGSMV